MKSHMTAKYRKAKKELTAKQKAEKNKRHEVRLRRDKAKALKRTSPKDKPIALKVESVTFPVTSTIIVDKHEPKEIIDKLKDTGAEVTVVSPARRAFQDK